MEESDDILICDEGPNMKAILEEYHQAGVTSDGVGGLEANQEVRRMVWPGQSPDGRRWDVNMPEGEQALPWNGSSDTRVPVVDSICNDEMAILAAAFSKAELHAVAVDPDRAQLAGGVSSYLHWLVHTKFARALRLEVELSAQYSREFGHAIAYVGWERELGKRRVMVTIEQLAGAVASLGEDPAQNPFAGLESVIMDPAQEDKAVEMLQVLNQGGFFAAILSSGICGIEDWCWASPFRARLVLGAMVRGRCPSATMA